MKKLIVGNWKMHGDAAMAHPLVQAVAAQADKCAAADVVICPPATLLAPIATWLVGSTVKMGGQDCHAEASGAYTGDISAPSLKDAGCAYVIVGHSERRQSHRENDDDVRKKAARAIRTGLIPIICVGETAVERDGGRAEEVVGRQVRESLPEEAASSHFVLAYEPVWAIGSGKTPTSDDIGQMHATIMTTASKCLSLGQDRIMVLYGGSVKAANAAGILQTEGVAGVLVGGASLKAEEFGKIIEAAVIPA